MKNTCATYTKIALMFAVILLTSLLVSCTQNNEQKFQETMVLMDTEVTITVYHQSDEIAKNAIKAAFNEIKRIDSLMGYSSKSELTLLNENGFLKNPSEEFLHNVNQSIRYSNLSHGAFDITVQPILDLYKKSFGLENRPPTKEEIMNTLKLINYQDIAVSKEVIRFRTRDMKITLGGITKGYAIDAATQVLKENGINSALVNAGGDIRALGAKPGYFDWIVALRDPRNENNSVTEIEIKNMSVATSGDYERYFINKSMSHIINPKTGISATGLISVTIIANKAIDADALSTSVFVLGKEKGLELVERLDDVECLIITEEKEIIRSSGFSGFETKI